MSRHDAKFKLPLVAFLALSTTAGYASEKEMRTDELSNQEFGNKKSMFEGKKTPTSPITSQVKGDQTSASPKNLKKISSILHGEAAVRSVEMLEKAQKEAHEKIALVEKEAEEKAQVMVAQAMAEAAEEVEKVKQENAKALDALRTSLVEEKERLQEEHAEMMAQQKKELEAIRQEIEKEKQTKGDIEAANTHLIEQQKKLTEARDDLQRQVHVAQQDAVFTYSGAKKVLSYVNPMSYVTGNSGTPSTTDQGKEPQTIQQDAQTPVVQNEQASVEQDAQAPVVQNEQKEPEVEKKTSLFSSFWSRKDPEEKK
ncbi:MAG: hypothetical protein K2X98_05295 [Alphaproteobacteria bacterium]|nr:hypothetical protein [Alphaproteobacteria bacterium]